VLKMLLPGSGAGGNACWIRCYIICAAPEI